MHLVGAYVTDRQRVVQGLTARLKAERHVAVAIGTPAKWRPTWVQFNNLCQKWQYTQYLGLRSANGRDVTKRPITYVNSIVSGRNYDTLTSIIAQLLTSRPFPDLCRVVYPVLPVTMLSIAGNETRWRTCLWHPCIHGDSWEISQKAIINRPQSFLHHFFVEISRPIYSLVLL